jgi:aspartate aminotransferase
MGLLAPRMTRFKPSASTEASARARELRAAGRDIVDFSIGEPDFATPDNIKSAANRAMDNDETHYTNTNGTAAVREAVCHKFRTENKLDYSTDEVMVSSGAKHMMFNAFMCTVSQGDEVIVPSPYWISYPNQVELAGGTPVIVDCGANTGFKLTPDALKEAFTDRTKWIVFNSPNNPTGAVYTRPELRALADVLLDHPDVWVMSDEIYEHFLYDDSEHVSILEVEPKLRDRSLIVNGVSKTYAMTGWRIGYAAGPAPLIKAMTKLQSQSTSCPSSVSQAATVEALLGPQQSIRDHMDILQERRDLIAGILHNGEGLRVERPRGAMYLFVDCAGCLGKTTPAGTTIENDLDFAKYLLNHVGVNVVPGAAYGIVNYFRLSFATSTEILQDGGERILRACRDLT